MPTTCEQERERQLLLRYHRYGDKAAREELITRFLPLARQLARRYQYTSEPLDDLFQVASLGLVKAIDRFDPLRGTAFTSYAFPIILGELKRYFRDNAWTLHVPRGARERSGKVRQTIDQLTMELGRVPTISEVAAKAGFAPEEVVEAIEASVAYEPMSLDAYRNGDEDDSWNEVIGATDGGYDLVEASATLGPVLRQLSERDRLVLQLRFVDDLTQSEIAEQIGVSQMHVSRLIRRALQELQRAVGVEVDPA